MLNAQEKLIGSMMMLQDCIPEVAQKLDAECFSPELAPAYNAIIGFYEAKGYVDHSALIETHRNVANLIATCHMGIEKEAINPTKARMLEWADIIIREAAVRDAQAMAVKIIENGATYEDILSLSQNLNSTFEARETDRGFKTQRDLVADYVRQMDTKPVVIESGIAKLDQYLRMKPSNLIVIGGRPSAGKTALSLQVAINIAKAGRKVCYFSLETSPEALERRIIANIANVPMSAVTTNSVDAMEIDRMASSLDMPLLIKSASGYDVAHIRRDAVREKADVVIVDYMQLLRAEGKSRYDQITSISIALHEMAQQTGMLVISLSQLNRNAARVNPTNADLRESGQIEQDADAIVLLSWADEETRDGYFFNLTKNKEGSVGQLPIGFDPTFQKFREVL